MVVLSRVMAKSRDGGFRAGIAAMICKAALER